jgi:hypothetical protein
MKLIAEHQLATANAASKAVAFEYERPVLQIWWISQRIVIHDLWNAEAAHL